MLAPKWHKPTNLKKLEVFMNSSMCGVKSYGKPYMALYWLDFHDPDDTVCKGLHLSVKAERSSDEDSSSRPSRQSSQNRNSCESSSVVLPKTMSAPIVHDGGELAGSENSTCSEDETEPDATKSDTSEDSVCSEDETENLAMTLWIADHVVCSSGSASEANSIFSPIFENDQKHGHAEDHLMRHLHALLSNIDLRKLASITIMQNASPCNRCSQKYLDYFTPHLNQGKVEIQFVCASLYRLKRPSCVAAEHWHQQLTDLEQHQQRCGLQSLIDAGSILKAPTFPDWQRLAAALQVPLDRFFWRTEALYTESLRGMEDFRLQNDLQDILVIG